MPFAVKREMPHRSPRDVAAQTGRATAKIGMHAATRPASGNASPIGRRPPSCHAASKSLAEARLVARFCLDPAHRDRAA